MKIKTDVVIFQSGDPIEGQQDSIDPANIGMSVQTITNAKLNQHPDTGQLRNSLMYRTKGKQGGFNDDAGDPSPQNTVMPAPAEEDEVFMGSNSDHAVYPEFGTRKMIAQPYLRPAVETLKSGSNAEDIIEKYSKENMRKELNKRKSKIFESIGSF